MKIIKLVPAIAIVMTMCACSSVNVIVDQDKNTDFSKYKTYSFLGWQNKSDEILFESDKVALRDAFTKEFEKRGMQRVNSGGDMQISLYVVVSVETAVSGYNDYVGGHGSYYHYGGGYATGNYNNTYTQREKEVGTMIMNVYDKSTKEQIWQAISTGTVTENPEKRAKAIPGKVSILMREFPVKH